MPPSYAHIFNEKIEHKAVAAVAGNDGEIHRQKGKQVSPLLCYASVVLLLLDVCDDSIWPFLSLNCKKNESPYHHGLCWPSWLRNPGVNCWPNIDYRMRNVYIQLGGYWRWPIGEEPTIEK